ncbi:Dam family site-specific DNA-(adenine-N6)-methyltransferase [Salmonella enterica]|nr:Dam family site-specific DNA-(adenine-N6)-methyltransferase [Salmonella enterica]EAR2960416.1 Dam family site-specific DNA-(adenine-N6)-methyltransferase [Salmonella enterica]EBD3757055.1 Dam family site-specific DNA-(adenine-N6)-methyltransferase [Salmonella enterica]EHF0522638.1 Dam family site-specific DNA-(adenine-N6)-methyltransferase [Salmonella enterica]EIY5615832.1 Dam family site-specific DNA-(adenine-N6)-methyltransferase [Salmonella enterica]
MKKPALIRSPLKWAGGKFDVVPQLREHLPKAGYLIEPFVGGGSVFMNTDYDHYVLCDSNPALINFYRFLTTDTTALIDRSWSLFRDGGTREAYERNRQTFNTITLATARLRGEYLEWAALFLYLNRHGFNGMHRTNQKGEFNIPFGKHSLPYFPYMEMRLFADKARETMTRFVCADFRITMKALPDICHGISFHADKLSDAVIYCDPPYLPLKDKDSFTHYNGKPFTREDHRLLVAHLIQANKLYGVRSVISNSDTEETRRIYSPFELHTLNVRRSVAASDKGRQSAKEVIGVYPSAPECKGEDVHDEWLKVVSSTEARQPVNPEVI